MSEEKRDGGRIHLKIPVKCMPIGSIVSVYQSVEIWTSDIHPFGTGFNWLISEKPQTCPVCETTVKDLTCAHNQCPYRAMRDVLVDSGWLEFKGLNHIPGWENEEKVLGKVMWFKMDDNGINFQFGVRFSREKPPIRLSRPAKMIEPPEPVPETSHPREVLQPFDSDVHEVHELDLERWKNAIRMANKQMLVVDEDQMECKKIFEFLQGIGYVGRTVSSGLVSLLDHFADHPKVVFFNPLFGGTIKMDLLENIKRACPETKVALLVEPTFKEDVLDHPNFHMADFIFLKPLDFDRIKDALHQL